MKSTSYNIEDSVYTDGFYALRAVEGYSQLVQYLKTTNCKIKSLRGNFLRFTNEAWLDLCDAIGNNNSVEELDLCYNAIGNLGMQPLSEALIKNTSIIKLDINGNDLNCYDAQMIRLYLERSSNITSLALKSNKFQDRGIEAIMIALEVNRSLTELDIASNSICDAGAEHLGRALMKNPVLKKVRLSSNDIKASGIRHLSHAFRLNESLTTIALSNNKLDSSGLKDLKKALTVNKSITKVVLWGCNIGDEGIRHINYVLKKNTSITYFDLGYNNLGDDGAISISKALIHNNSVTHLNICGNRIGNIGVKHLRKLIRQNKMIVKLLLDYNKVSLYRSINIQNFLNGRSDRITDVAVEFCKSTVFNAKPSVVQYRHLYVAGGKHLKRVNELIRLPYVEFEDKWMTCLNRQYLSYILTLNKAGHVYVRSNANQHIFLPTELVLYIISLIPVPDKLKAMDCVYKARRRIERRITLEQKHLENFKLNTTSAIFSFELIAVCAVFFIFTTNLSNSLFEQSTVEYIIKTEGMIFSLLLILPAILELGVADKVLIGRV